MIKPISLTVGTSVTRIPSLFFADALSTLPEFWLNLQQQYDLWHELQKHDHIETLPQIAESSASLHPYPIRA